MIGFDLSDDYRKLWRLALDGYRIPAWVLSKEKIHTLVEVKYQKLSRMVDIGTRGISYSGIKETKEEFVENCTILQLKFIMPNENENSKI
jgi:hypothetical protein